MSLRDAITPGALLVAGQVLGEPRLAAPPHVVLHPYPEAEHAVVQWLIDHQQIDDVLASLLILDEHADQSALAGSPAPAMADSSFPVKSGAFTR